MVLLPAPGGQGGPGGSAWCARLELSLYHLRTGFLASVALVFSSVSWGHHHMLSHLEAWLRCFSEGALSLVGHGVGSQGSPQRGLFQDLLQGHWSVVCQAACSARGFFVQKFLCLEVKSSDLGTTHWLDDLGPVTSPFCALLSCL